MADDLTGAGSGGGPPSYPGGSALPPPMPPPPTGPPAAPPPPPGTAINVFPPPGEYAVPGPTTTTGLPLASWGIRVGGYLIDVVMLGVVNYLIGLALRHDNALRLHYTMTNNTTVRHGSFSFLALIISEVIFIAYSTILIGSQGATIGMMAVGIRAVRVSDSGPLNMGSAFGRAVVRALLDVTIIAGLLSDFWPLWDPRRQTLQDKAIGSVVVRARSYG